MSELIRKLKEKKYITKIKVKDDISDELLSKEIPQVGSVKIVAAVKEEIGPVAPEIVVTRETNPELMDICVAQKWAANNDYMTYEETIMINDDDVKAEGKVWAGGVMYTSKFITLTHFEEFQWFRGVHIINYGMFENCPLTSLIIPDSVTTIYDAFQRCATLTSLVIPNSVATIGPEALSGLTGLTALIIGNSVTYIGMSALNNLTNLNSITCLAMSAPETENNQANGTFGWGETWYVGRNTYDQGINKLKVPTGATGYDTGEWLDPLQNAEKCGFTIEYI